MKTNTIQNLINQVKNDHIKNKNYFKDLINDVKINKTLDLDARKQIFIDYVLEACNHFKISVPSINFDSIEHFKGGEDGHFHVEECKICVDESKLKFLKEDKIRELAYHEVTHAFMGGHDGSFWTKMKEGMNK